MILRSLLIYVGTCAKVLIMTHETEICNVNAELGLQLCKISLRSWSVTWLVETCEQSSMSLKKTGISAQAQFLNRWYWELSYEYIYLFAYRLSFAPKCYSVQARGDSLSNTSYTESQQASDTEQRADDTEHAASSLEYSASGSEIQGRVLKSNQ